MKTITLVLMGCSTFFLNLLAQTNIQTNNKYICQAKKFLSLCSARASRTRFLCFVVVIVVTVAGLLYTLYVIPYFILGSWVFPLSFFSETLFPNLTIWNSSICVLISLDRTSDKILAVLKKSPGGATALDS